MYTQREPNISGKGYVPLPQNQCLGEELQIHTVWQLVMLWVVIDSLKCLHINARDNVETVVNLQDDVSCIRDLWIMLSFLKA